MKRNIHIIIAEPSSIVQEGLKAVFLHAGLKPIVSKAATLDEIQLVQLKRECDFVIINPSLIQNNIKAFNNLRNQFEKIKWIGLVYAFYEQHLLSLFDTTITISDTPGTIADVISKLATPKDANDQSQWQDVLSDRETDVLKLLASGMANKEIADKLAISINTVITHRKNISQKTGIKSVSGLTIYAVVKKLVTLESHSD